MNVYSLDLSTQDIRTCGGAGMTSAARNGMVSPNEPLLRPGRRLIPPKSGLDLSPLLVMLLLQVISRLIPLPGVFR